MRRRRAALLAVAVATACGVAPLVGGCVGPPGRMAPGRPSDEQLARRRQLSQEAQAAMDRGDWPAARAGLIALSAEAPDSPEVQHRLGRVLATMGDPNGAEAAYRRALELDPDYADALCGLGHIEHLMGRQVEALEDIDASIKLDPDRAEAHLIRGSVLEALGQPDEALAAYFLALGADPSSADALLRIAVLQLGRQQHDQALARLTHALEIRPEDPEIRLHRGRARLALGQPREAVEDLKAAAAKLPGRSDVFYHLALALEQDRKLVDALAAARQAETLSPTSTEARALTERLRR